MVNRKNETLNRLLFSVDLDRTDKSMNRTYLPNLKEVQFGLKLPETKFVFLQYYVKFALPEISCFVSPQAAPDCVDERRGV